MVDGVGATGRITVIAGIALLCSVKPDIAIGSQAGRGEKQVFLRPPIWIFQLFNLILVFLQPPISTRRPKFKFRIVMPAY